MEPPARDPLVGRLVAGRYRVLARIARGGMATVFRAEDVRLGREIALKVMHPHLAESDDFVSRFHDEARAAASLSHRHVVAVHDQGEDGDLVWLAMELLPGRTLRDRLRERGAFTPAETFEVAEAVLLALVEAHATGLVHRDVKPENVLLARDGTWKVNDFGLARAAASSRTATGSLLGTPEYIAPETARTGQVDERVDLYAVGIMLFELLTGRQPHTGDVPFQVVWSHVTTDVPPPSRWAPYLPPAVDELVADACERDPEARVRTATTMLADLRRAWSLLDPDVLDRRPPVPVVAADADQGATAVIARGRVPGGRTVGGAVPATATLARVHEPRERPAYRTDDRADDRDDDRGADDDLDRVGRHAGDDGVSRTAVLTRPRRRGPGLAGVLLVLLVLSLGAGGALWYYEAGPGALRDVPELVGRTAPAAERQLQAAGLGSTTTSTFDEQAPEGTVVGTDPAAGEQVHKNGSVTLVVSAGPELFGVPDVRGLGLEEARSTLGAAGLVPGAVAEAYSDDVEAGLVLSTDPTAGTDLRGDSEVALVLSRGPEPVPVPDVVGGSVEQARTALEDAGLRLGGTTEEFDAADAGTVVAQDPEGTDVRPGTVVDVVVSRGPEPVAVPDVFESPFDAAAAELEALGFVVERRGSGIFDRVVSQDPSAGTELAPGSTVVVTTF
ncbi:Stk1 family PASTA domain-containing Ser/Thr kinase [Aquipuribacter sp. MA13-6]|uniref:Stk1 family PASTA domain-containing Ser/Thr kinase n=1 Tax=unclassified Aquipuribacter TaxID=2635084 RepID=UPI003EEED0EA